MPEKGQVLAFILEFLQQEGFSRSTKALKSELEKKAITLKDVNLEEILKHGFSPNSDTTVVDSKSEAETKKLKVEPSSSESSSSDSESSSSEAESSSSDSDSESSSSDSESSSSEAESSSSDSDSESSSSDSESSSSDSESSSSDSESSSSDSESSSSDSESSSSDSESSSSDSESSSSDSESSSSDSESSSSDEKSNAHKKVERSSGNSSKKRIRDENSNVTTKRQKGDISSSQTESITSVESRNSSTPEPELKPGQRKHFSRIDKDKIVFEDTVLTDNKYKGAAGTWGEIANDKLTQVRGKDFTKSKNKMKKGSYRGGTITLSSGSYKFSE